MGEPCTHHWVIDPPGSATSWGRCRKCGEEKEFANTIPASEWAVQSHGSNTRLRRPAGRGAVMLSDGVDRNDLE